MKTMPLGAIAKMRTYVVVGFLAILALVGASSAFAADPLAVITSDASLEAKAEACRVLAYEGRPDAVPVLAPMLTDEKLSHLARYALEPMPYPEAGAALREALGKTSGRLKAGIISSLAVRKDRQAVPALVDLLGDADAQVAEAAAAALGAIASPESRDALKGALGKAQTPPNVLRAVFDALLDCAEAMQRNGQVGEAREVYDDLLSSSVAPRPVVAAALRGAILTRGGESGVALLVERLRGDDETAFDAALRVAREMAGQEGVTSALATVLPALADSRKIKVLDLFTRDDAVLAGPAALAEAGNGAATVRVAALHALGRMGYSPSLKLMEQLATAEDGPVTEAARQALCYFPGPDGDAVLMGMLGNEKPAVRRLAVDLIAQGGLEDPAPVLLNAAQTDADENVRVAALEGMRPLALMTHMDSLLERLVKAPSVAEVQAAERSLAALCDRQKKIAGGGAAPVAMVDAFDAAFAASQGDAKVAALRLLGATGSRKAFETLQAVAASGEAKMKEAAQLAICEWPTLDALPFVMELAASPSGSPIRMPAMRGAVRLIGQLAEPEQALAQYAAMMERAKDSPDERKLILSGVARVAHPKAFDFALNQLEDPAVKAEAIVAAATIAKAMGANPREDAQFFNGSDLTGWEGDAQFWRFEDGAIVGQSTPDKSLKKNNFIWSVIPVGDFYMVVDVKLEPETGNAGIQFRSIKMEDGRAVGYQADAGKDVWGRLYHEAGRGKLDWNGRADKAVKPGDWNRCEILAVGPAIWIAVNGQLSVSCLDLANDERTGLVAFQLHAGPPMKNSYRPVKLVHNPKLELAGHGPEELIADLTPLKDK